METSIRIVFMAVPPVSMFFSFPAIAYDLLFDHQRKIFESLCDIQHTLPFKGAEEIREEAQLLLKHWAAPDGGFILSDYGDGQAIGVALDKKRIMLDAFLEADPWRREA